MNLHPRWTVPAAALLLSSFVFAQSSTPTHRRSSTAAGSTASAARRRAAADATPGLAAVGSMPAAAGPAKPLYALRYVDLKEGTGELAKPGMFYTVHYTGWLTDGTKFDSSLDRGEPIIFRIGTRRVIIGWDTGFEGMHVGGKRRLLIPYQLAYGESGRPPVIPAKADLIFDLELLAQSENMPQQPAPPAPASEAPKPEAPKPGTSSTPATQPGTNPVTSPAEKPQR